MRDQRRTQRSHLPLAELAARQHGVVSSPQLRSLGYSKHAVARAASAGRLHRVHRGVYAVGHARLTWHGRCLAAVLAAEPAVASHETAGWLWDLLRTRPGLHVTAPTRRRARAGTHPPSRGARSGGDASPRGARPGGDFAPSRKSLEYTVHFSRLRGEDLDRREEIPVTSLARTLLDLAATVPAYRLERAIERAEELGHFDLAPAEELLARAGGHAGRGALLRALDLYRDDPALLRSGAERRFRELVRAAGLPAPAMNFNVAGFEVDAYWPSHRFGVEIDAFQTHGSRAAFERDRRRQEDLKLAGVEMTRVTGTRMKREPKAVADRLAALLEQRCRQLRGDPA